MFAAILNLDRRPIDPADHANPARELCQPRGTRHVLLLHSTEDFAMRAAETSAIESLESRLWLVGRLRLDARDELEAALDCDRSESDAGLCLRAYAKWGEHFLDRLSGDFAFVLWDAAAEKLIAVRDQLGVRPLYLAGPSRQSIVGDSLDWVLSQPGIDRELDDTWIADYLTVNRSLDPERTAWRGVRRLPAAHLQIASDGLVTQRRYWRLSIDEPLRLDDRRMYGEIFRDLACRAVRDRLPRQGAVGISLSGGLDSTALAALSVEAMGDAARVRGACFHFERLIEDDERPHAQLAARHLGIALDEIAFDDTQYDPRWRELPADTPEPSAGALRVRFDRELGQVFAARAGIWLEGEGPDNALRFERGPYLSWLRRQGRWRELGGALLGYAAAKGLHHWGRTLERYTVGAPGLPDGPGLPPWLSRDLVGRLRLDERHEQAAPLVHPWHPSAMASFADTTWQSMFGEAEIEERHTPVVWRHPFLDLRVLTFMLSVPPVPWAWRKLLVRRAMQADLPAAILARDKSPLRAHPLWPAMRGHTLPPLEATGTLARWIDVPRLVREGTDSASLENLLAAHALDHWLATHKP